MNTLTVKNGLLRVSMKAILLGIMLSWSKPDFCDNPKATKVFYESLVRLTIVSGATDSALRYKSAVLDLYRERCGKYAIIY